MFVICIGYYYYRDFNADISCSKRFSHYKIVNLSTPKQGFLILEESRCALGVISLCQWKGICAKKQYITLQFMIII